jgi:predicted Zn-dependent protease
VPGPKLRWAGVLLIAACCGVGCASPSSSNSRNVSEWARRQGGLEGADGLSQQRVDRVARPLVAAYGQPVNVRILACDPAGAYAWPGGEVFVTRRLTEILDDGELAAAVAHELGHLMSEPKNTAATLAPTAGAPSASADRGDDEERQADARGAALLERAGLPATAMTRMLETVADRGGLDPAERRAVAKRARVRQSSTPRSR